MLFLYILVGVIYLVVWYYISVEFAKAAEEKGFGFSKYFWYTFVFGLAGILLIIALPNRRLVAAIHELRTEKEGKPAAPVGGEAPVVKPLLKEAACADGEKIDNSAQTVRCSGTGDGTVTCPLCNFEQPGNRKVCWHCGAKFE